MNNRHATILQLLQDEQRVGIRALARRFAVSEMTIRRDLIHLEGQGLLMRTHGGGVSTEKVPIELQHLSRRQVSPGKVAVGKTAAGLVTPGQMVMIDTGTTTLELARHLPRHPDISVVTTSLWVAEELYGSPVKVLLLGGFLRQEFPSTYGPMTENELIGLHVDVLFMGCDGAISDEGFFSADLHIAKLEQLMIRSAARVVVVTESSKFGRRAFVRYAAPEQVQTVVSDAALSEQDQAHLNERGVEVIRAEGV